MRDCYSIMCVTSQLKWLVQVREEQPFIQKQNMCFLSCVSSQFSFYLQTCPQRLNVSEMIPLHKRRDRFCGNYRHFLLAMHFPRTFMPSSFLPSVSNGFLFKSYTLVSSNNPLLPEVYQQSSSQSKGEKEASGQIWELFT